MSRYEIIEKDSLIFIADTLTYNPSAEVLTTYDYGIICYWYRNRKENTCPLCNHTDVTYHTDDKTRKFVEEVCANMNKGIINPEEIMSNGEYAGEMIKTYPLMPNQASDFINAKGIWEKAPDGVYESHLENIIRFNTREHKYYIGFLFKDKHGVLHPYNETDYRIIEVSPYVHSYISYERV